MAHFEKIKYQDEIQFTYEVCDDYGHTAQLKPEQALELWRWLDEQKSSLGEESLGDLPDEQA